MATSTDVLVEQVRAKRQAVDDDLEELRVRTRRLDPRATAARWGQTAVPVLVGATALWFWRRRRRAVTSLQDLLVQELQDLHRVETQLVPALERMHQAATNPDLARLFERHAEETRVHEERLQRVLRSVGAKPKPGTSKAVAALDMEARRRLRRKADPDVRDAWLVAMAQRAEHLEIADYGSARSFAATLGHTYAAQLLQQTLDEERAMDEQLTRLAERFVNPQSIR